MGSKHLGEHGSDTRNAGAAQACAAGKAEPSSRLQRITAIALLRGQLGGIARREQRLLASLQRACITVRPGLCLPALLGQHSEAACLQVQGIEGRQQ